MRTQRSLAALAVAGVLLLAGCSANSGDTAGEADGGFAGEAPAQEGADEGAGEEGGGARDDDATAGRLFVTTGTATVTTDEPRTAAAQLATFVGTIDGHVQERV